MLSLRSMKKNIARCLSDIGGILHSLLDFGLAVQNVAVVPDNEGFLKAGSFLSCFSQCTAKEADVTG